MAKYDTLAGQAKILPDENQDERDSLVSVKDATQPKKDPNAELAAWVVARVNDWKTDKQTNYLTRWDEYERLWRGIWAESEKQRQSERSKIITPALSEAVENSVSEIEEAIFGRGGDFFQIEGQHDDSDETKAITRENEVRLKEDLAKTGFAGAVSEALMNGAVFGSGIGEILMKTFKVRDIVASLSAALPAAPAAPVEAPGQQGAGLPPELTALLGAAGGAPAAPQTPYGEAAVPATNTAAQMMPEGTHQMPDGSTMADADMPLPGLPGSEPEPKQERVEKEVSYACLKSVNPRNFQIDPNARTVDDALGCAIEEYVGAHLIKEGMESGDYLEVDLAPTVQSDTEIAVDPQVISQNAAGNVHVIRYYGLVPEHLLFPPEQMASLKEGEASPSDEPGKAKMVEAIVTIVNQKDLLKAVENPYFMKDRPVVAFPWDIVPGRFWGRGICEKGAAPQKLLDAEYRSRMDALAFSGAPMMGMDASRLPRGFKLQVYPGKSILTNGDPSTILKPFQFGQVDQNTYQQADALDKMVQRATGALDGVAMAQGGVSGQARSGAVSMSLTGIVKRHRRTLMNFADKFLAPALEKIMWRQMEFYPERYKPLNFTFNVSGTMGIMQREYESQTLVQMLQALPPESPAHGAVIKGILGNTGLANRQQLIDMLDQPPPQAQIPPELAALQSQLGQAQAQLALVKVQAEIAKLQAETVELQTRAGLNQAKTQTELVEPEIRAAEVASKGIYSIEGDDQQAAEFDRRLQLVNAQLTAEDIASNERLAHVQAQASVERERIKAGAKVRGDMAKAGAQVAAATQKSVAVQGTE